MREIDFLPEWYKEGQRQQLHVRRQYAALAVVFIVMIGCNATSTHRIARANAALARLDSKRVEAETACQEFNTVTSDLNKVRAKADLIERIDSKINVAAVLAELSHIIGETVVLGRAEFAAEPLADDDKGQRAGDAGVRIADGKSGASQNALVGSVRFRIVLSGVAVSPADVAALVRRLDDSAYFHRVYASFWRNGKVQVSTRSTPTLAKPRADAVSAGQMENLEVTEFEVVCYLDNYRGADNR
jgi:hypothetical protein